MLSCSWQGVSDGRLGCSRAVFHVSQRVDSGVLSLSVLEDDLY